MGKNPPAADARSDSRKATRMSTVSRTRRVVARAGSRLMASIASSLKVMVAFMVAIISLRLPFVDANRVAIRIGNHRHAADGRGHWFDAELYVVDAQMGYGVVEVLHLQRHGAAVRAGLEGGRATQRQGIRAEFVFDPLAVFRIYDGRGLQAEHAFVKLPRPRHVGDGVATEGDFGDFEHEIILTVSDEELLQLNSANVSAWWNYLQSISSPHEKVISLGKVQS